MRARKKKPGNLPQYVPTPAQIARECEIIRSTAMSLRTRPRHAIQELGDAYDDAPGIREYDHRVVMGRATMPDGPELCDSEYWNQEQETL